MTKEAASKRSASAETDSSHDSKTKKPKLSDAADKISAEKNLASVEKLQTLNETLLSFDCAPFIEALKTSLGEGKEEQDFKKMAGERLISILQTVKSLSSLLKDPSKKPRAALSLRDVALPTGSDDLAQIPLWKQQGTDTTHILMDAVSELLGETEENQSVHLNTMVDAFAEELDQLRQGEDLGANRLELLIDSLKSGKLSF